MPVRYYKYKPVPSGSHRLAAEAAVEVLRETNNPAICYGDGGLFHLVADKIGWPHEMWFTEDRVLNAIDRHHSGHLVKRYFMATRGKARVFYLPEYATFPNDPCHCLNPDCQSAPARGGDA